ncbi:hypothetical protein HDV01_005994 [Terramyces sp. JEL0728]|nr:hypothetical protein HDV01_005994 [Terramyces sp. JEL0728]
MAAILARSVLHNPQIKPTIIKQRINDNDKSRVVYLEKTIDRLQRDHGESIKELHSEISGLATICSEMMLKIANDVPTAHSEESPAIEKASTPIHLNTPLPTSLRNSLVTLIQHSLPQIPVHSIAQSQSFDIKEIPVEIDDKLRVKIAECKETMTEHNDNDSIYLLVQKEKRKYQQMMERVIEDKKKKAAEIDHLKVEIDLMKRVMKLAGVSIETKDLQAILRNSGSLITRTSVLPPIPKEAKKTKKKERISKLQQGTREITAANPAKHHTNDVQTAEPEVLVPLNDIVQETKSDQPQKEVESEEDEKDIEFDERSCSPTTNATYKDNSSIVENTVSCAQPPASKNENEFSGEINLDGEINELNINEMNQSESFNDIYSDGATAFAPPNGPYRKANSVRSNRYRLKSDPIDIPAILTHNQNLDYNNRAHLYLDNLSYVESDSSTINVPQIGNKRREKSLPPVIDRKGVLGLAKESFKNAKTTYSGRFWRAKIVKDKQMKDLHEKTL